MNDQERYDLHIRRMQTGVAAVKADPNTAHHSETEPKHLRVGVNAALVDSGALAQLLIEKGIITREEYLKSLADAMEREANKYEKELSEFYSAEIKLGPAGLQ
jgi:hypothetical protein